MGPISSGPSSKSGASSSSAGTSSESSGFFFSFFKKPNRDSFGSFLRFLLPEGGSSIRRFHSSSGAYSSAAVSWAGSSSADTPDSFSPADTSSGMPSPAPGSSPSASLSPASSSSLGSFSRRRSVRDAKAPVIAPNAERIGLLLSGIMPSRNSSESDI